MKTVAASERCRMRAEEARTCADDMQYAEAKQLMANLEQQITPDLGVFMRTGLASPNVEPDRFLYEIIDLVGVPAELHRKGAQL